MYIEHILQKHPIIAAIKDKEHLEEIPTDKVDVIFLLRGELSTLKDLVERAIELDTLVFLHIDMAKGVKADREGIKYLAREVGIDGIITTRGRLIKEAKKEGLITVQRLFLLDSQSLTTGFNMIKGSKPDLVEVLPGPAVGELIGDLKKGLDTPIIAGGLVKKLDQVEILLQADGVLGISTSKKELWEASFGE